MGTPDVGTASAGMASRAADAATAFANPAGMTRLNESQLMVGVQPIYADVKFDTQSSTFGGGNGGNAGGIVPTGSLSYVHDVSDDLKLGLTAGSYLGLGVKFDDNWAGRYYVQQEDFTTSFLNGAVGYKVNDWLSVGGGLSLVYGQLGVQTNINNLLDGGSDGRLKYKDTDTAPGWNAGLADRTPGRHARGADLHLQGGSQVQGSALVSWRRSGVECGPAAVRLQERRDHLRLHAPESGDAERLP